MDVIAIMITLSNQNHSQDHHVQDHYCQDHQHLCAPHLGLIVHIQCEIPTNLSRIVQVHLMNRNVHDRNTLIHYKHRGS